MQSQQCWHHSIWFALPGQDFEAFEDICFRFWNWSSVEILNFLMEIGVKNFWYDLKAVALVNGDSTQSFGLLSLWQCFFDCLLERLQRWDGFQNAQFSLARIMQEGLFTFLLMHLLHSAPLSIYKKMIGRAPRGSLVFPNTSCMRCFVPHIIVPHIIVPHIIVPHII